MVRHFDWRSLEITEYDQNKRMTYSSILPFYLLDSKKVLFGLSVLYKLYHEVNMFLLRG